MMTHDCPYIADCYATKKSDDGCDYVLVMEYCSKGTINDNLAYYRSHQQQAAKAFKQTMIALNYLNDRHIAHRDIKPENILVDDNYDIRVADFGISRSVRDSFAATQAGTPYYMAPEIHTGEHYGCETDLWSACATFYYLYTNKIPFDAVNCVSRQGLYRNKMNDNLYEPITDSQCHFKQVASLVDRVLTASKLQRPSIDEVVRWLADIDESTAADVKQSALVTKFGLETSNYRPYDISRLATSSVTHDQSVVVQQTPK